MPEDLTMWPHNLYIRFFEIIIHSSSVLDPLNNLSFVGNVQMPSIVLGSSYMFWRKAQLSKLSSSKEDKMSECTSLTLKANLVYLLLHIFSADRDSVVLALLYNLVSVDILVGLQLLLFTSLLCCHWIWMDSGHCHTDCQWLIWYLHLKNNWWTLYFLINGLKASRHTLSNFFLTWYETITCCLTYMVDYVF